MAILGVPVSVAVGLSGILKEKQKLGVTFNSDEQDVIDFKKFIKVDSLNFGQKIYEGLLFSQCIKENKENLILNIF